MCVILIAIGMHTNLCIASLAFIACNWELLVKELNSTGCLLIIPFAAIYSHYLAFPAIKQCKNW